MSTYVVCPLRVDVVFFLLARDRRIDLVMSPFALRLLLSVFGQTHNLGAVTCLPPPYRKLDINKYIYTCMQQQHVSQYRI